MIEKINLRNISIGFIVVVFAVGAVSLVRASSHDYDASASAQETEIVTQKVRLSDKVVRETVTVTKFDSDGDGILDEDDKFPTVNDYFIVEDKNHNGIVDSYEK